MSAVNTITPRAGELYSHTAIRGIAALCVVGYHAMLGSAGQGYTDDPIQNFFLTSFIFVDFFFILSGYIMFENYGKKIGGPGILTNSIQYWKKRLLKILPNYYFWLLVAIALTYLKWIYFGDRDVTYQCTINSFLKHFFLVQNLVGSCYYFNTPLWSIAVEMLAYLIFPLIIFCHLGQFLKISIVICLYFILFSYSETIDVIDGFFSVIRCLAGFICGVTAAKISFRVLPDSIQITLVVLLVCTISLNYQIISLCLMFVITIATAHNTGILARACRMKLPYMVGRSSFSIYLAHVPVGMIVSTLAYKLESETGIPLGSDWRIIVPLEILVSCIVGIIAFSHVERRFEDITAKRKNHLHVG